MGKRPRKQTRQSARSRDDYQACLELLGKIRADANVSESELARRLGKHQSWVGKSEDGSRRVDFVELIDICEAIGADVADFMRRCKRVLRKHRIR